MKRIALRTVIALTLAAPIAQAQTHDHGVARLGMVGI